MENEIVTVCCNIVLRIDIEKCVNCTGFSSGLKKRGIIPKWLAFACQTPMVARYQSAKKHQPRKTQLGIRHVFPIWTAHRRGCFNCLYAFLAAVMSVEAVRTTLWDTIVRFFDEYLSISYVTETQPPKQLEAIKEPSGPFFCQSPMPEHIRHIDAYIPHKNRPLKCQPFRLDF